MCFTTFFTQKQIMTRSGPVEGQAATVQKLLLYGMPLSLFVSGFFFPIGVLLYWFTNNLWTLGQQFFILRKMPPPGSDAAKAKAAADKPVIDPQHARAQAGRQAGPHQAAAAPPTPPARPDRRTTRRRADGARAARRRTARPTAGRRASSPAAPTRAGQSPPNKGKRKRR